MNRPLVAFAALLLTLTIAAFTPPVRADEGGTDSDGANKEQVAQFLAGLHFRADRLELPTAHAALTPKNNFRVLDAKDAEAVLTQLWGNPPDSDTLALLVPGNVDLSAPDGWAVVVSYSDEGYVSDDDAQKIDYDDMLKTMKAAVHDANAERQRQGYGSLELVGWAAKPHYDASGKKLYWAKELEFDGNKEHTLNYAIRVLGRRGYLSLNAVSAMSEMPKVQAGMQGVLDMAEFTPGERYADYNSSTDKTAAYGLAALVAGGIAAKAGLFGKLLALLLAAKKLVVVALAAIAAFVKKLFSRKSA